MTRPPLTDAELKERYDLNKLLRFAREKAVSFSVTFSEGDNQLEITIDSPAPVEHFYMKRVPSIEYFIEKWMEHVGVKEASDD